MSAAIEDPKQIDIEEWLTLATAPSPTKLQTGQSPNMENVWVDEKPGSVITAPGLVKLGTLPSNNPGTFCIDYFKTSSGTQTFVVSDNSTVWTTVDFQNFTSIITGLSSSFQLRGAVIRDKLWLTNGSDAVRTFDGSTVTVLDGTGGTPNVPKGRFIAYHDERVWLYHQPSNRSLVSFSAVADSSGTAIDPDNASAWPSSNGLQISQGDADFGTGLFAYRGYLFFAKQYTIWRLAGQDEYTYTRIRTRASTGTRFNESIALLDSLIHFIGIDGIYTFDGDETVRISDIIDPATATQAAFGFNQLQQPNQNNKFWEVTATADWAAGTAPRNLAIDNAIALAAADDSEADFEAGALLTNIDTTYLPGYLFVAVTAAGHSANDATSGKPCTLTVSGGTQIGSGANATDGDFSNASGAASMSNGGYADWDIVYSAATNINWGLITLKSFYNTGTAVITIRRQDGNLFTIASASEGTVVGASLTLNPGTARDINITLVPDGARELIIRATSQGSGVMITLTEIRSFTTAYNTSAKFTSRTLDLGATPASLGNFNADYVVNGAGQAITFFTQSSADGTSWDSEVACTSGGAIGSTPRRYLRWGANFTTNGGTSPYINAVYLPSIYTSVIHDTGGSIFSWGAFESDRSYFNQTINFYYRTATTSGGISSATWNLIVPGGALSDSVSNQFVQFKIEILGGVASGLPSISSVTINWVQGTGVQPQTLQNVAAAAWRNRYWLSAAGAGATANNTILIRGKKTFGNPWQLKDWNILAFTRWQDSLVGLSSVDGSIYQLDTGFSINGAAMDSFFETGDFVFGGFKIQLVEILVEVERKSGSYSLSVGWSSDRGVTYTEKTVDLTLGSSPLSYIKRLNFDATCDRIRFRVRINAADQPFEVHRLIAFYHLMPVRGSFDGN